MDVDDIISQKCKEENGFDYQWIHTSEINKQHLTGLFEERWNDDFLANRLEMIIKW